MNDRRLFSPAQAILVILTLLAPLLPAGMTSSWKSAARDFAYPGHFLLREVQLRLAAPISSQIARTLPQSSTQASQRDGSSENTAQILAQELDLEREKTHRLTALLLTQSHVSHPLNDDASISQQPSQVVPVSFQQPVFNQTSKSSRNRHRSRRLFQVDLIETTLLGNELSRNWKSGAIISQGSRQGIEESAWVVKSPEPLLDIGHDHDVAPADLVLTAGLTVVGKVERVGNWTSTFLPITHARFRCRAMVVRVAVSSQATPQPTVLTQTILAGEGTDTCRLEKISDNVGLRVGDEVYSLEDDGLLDRPLFLGTITKATLPQEDRYWEVQVTPPFTHPSITPSDPNTASPSQSQRQPFPSRLSILRLRPNSSRFENHNSAHQEDQP